MRDSMIKRISLQSKKRWKVIFRHKNNWLCGIYIPEFTDACEIQKFEKHNGPELFLLLQGKVTLVLLEGNKRRKVPLKKDEVVIVNTWHNAYRPKGGKGVVLVIEKDNISTRRKIALTRARRLS